LVVLVVLGGCHALPSPVPLAYTQALAQAVESYNRRPEVQNSYRLLSADPEPAPGVELSSLHSLNFTMMETECNPSARIDTSDCDFKENGLIKECSGPVQFLESNPEIDLRCTDASDNPVLVQRGRFGRFLSRIRRFRPRINYSIRAHGSIRLG
ncbi:CTHL2 protein, partial [Rhinopomastus cyanomelas]|nr:CTHL2 protein [Rhinopomastus cyanomelas]